MGYIDKKQLEKIIEPYKKTSYANYIKKLL
jgi:hypothetical protein